MTDKNEESVANMNYSDIVCFALPKTEDLRFQTIKTGINEEVQ